MLSLIRDRLTQLPIARQAAAAVVGLFAIAPVFGQERRAEVSATYLGLNLPPIVQPENAAKTRFSYQYPDRKKWLDAAGPAAIATPNNTPVPGILAWEVPPTEFGTAGMERNFRTYCAEAPVGVVSGATYRYSVRSPAVPDAFHLPDTEAGNAESFRRATYIRELFGRYYIPSLTESRAARAFQIALWEIIHESNWVEDKAPPLDLSAGSFTAIAEQDDADSVGLSRDYLKSLTGNDNVYYENPDLAGRELVWMQGLPSPLANNVVP